MHKACTPTNSKSRTTKLRIIATDGQIVHLTGLYDYIIAHSGECYSFILDTKEVAPPGAGGNYWIQAETLEASGILSDGRPACTLS